MHEPFAVRKPGGLWVAGTAADEPANAAVVRRLYDHLNARNEKSVLALYSRNAELHSFVSTVDGGKFVGCKGVRHWYETLVGTLGMTIETGELMAHRKYVLSIPTVHISAGGRQQSFEAGIVYEVSATLIQRFFGYANVGAALKKLGGLLHGEHELAV
jgi:SnoaL-like domain